MILIIRIDQIFDDCIRLPEYEIIVIVVNYRGYTWQTKEDE